MPETLIELGAESSRSLLPGEGGHVPPYTSPWQTDGQHCTPGCVHEVVIGDVMPTNSERRRRSRTGQRS